MSKIKLIATDLDDTLLSRDLRISARNRRAIAQARAQGVQVVISTGRMYRSAVRIARELGLDVPLITYQGSLIRTVTGETLLEQPIPVATARRAINFGRELGMTVLAYVDDHLYTAYINRAVAYYASVSQVPVTALGDLARGLPGPAAKILMTGEIDLCRRALAAGEERLGRELYITQSKPQYVECVHHTASKGAALSFLAARLGIAMEQVMALGDNYNDIPLLQAAGLKIAMGNAVPALKEIADFVSGDCDDSGFAQAVERFVLHEQ